MKRLPSPLRLWLAIVFAGALVIGFTAWAVQQNYRQSANDPQIQFAEDTAAALNAGRTPLGLVPATTIDLRTSLAPFVIITDQKYHVLASSGRFKSVTPLPPPSVFAAVAAGKSKGSPGINEDRLTWQPAPGVREAAVVTRYNGGYVIAARSLRETERRASQLTLSMAAALVVLVAGVSILLWLT